MDYYNELVQLSEKCKRLSLIPNDFVMRRQFDELSRRYRRLADQVIKLESRLRRAPARAA